MNTRWLALAVVVAQLAVVGGMAVQREWIVRQGKVVRLRTVPFDPNDPMRGAYSRLLFDFNRVPEELARGEVTSWLETAKRGDYRQLRRYRDRVVYASLAPEPDGVIKLRGLSTVQPSSGLFLRGRVESVDTAAVQVRYGLEAYFSSKAEAQKLDRERTTERQGVILDATVAVGTSGIAVLTGVEWEPLGLTIRRPERDRSVRAQAGATRPPPPSTVELELKNHGTEPLAIIVRPGGRSFRLIDGSPAGSQVYTWVNATEPLAPATDELARVLKPGETYREVLDLRDPYWRVRRVKPHPQHPEGELVAPVDVTEAWGTTFQFEYTPGVAIPAPRMMAGARVWTLRLPSARWSPAGMID